MVSSRYIRFKFFTKSAIVLMLNTALFLSAKAQIYNEPYRPQFHVTPEFGFMGDPNGPIKHDGTYHLFYWGHLMSKDLIHWTQRNTNALNGTPGGYGNWSGSVVLDKENTAGFNTAQDTAMIAVYTLHQNATKIQQQAISISLNHVSFNYYPQNPVLPYNGPDFRDPQVFWHKETGRWIMVITKPLDRSIEVYSSPNIKDWTLESIFSDRGAKREVWEVPDLFQLPVNDDANNMKWVMTCGMGPNRMQYWVGDFDGSKFTLDPNENLLTGKHVIGEIFADFENGFGQWKTEGTAFGSAPANGSLANQQRVDGFTGFGFLNSFHGGDDATGKMISTDFIINKRYINFQIGGGSMANIGFKIIVENQAVETIVNSANSERMQWRGIDVSQHIGKNARIEIFDNATGGWGHIIVDHIVFSDVQYDSRIENANWMDWGADFYAHKSFRNYDEDDDRTIGLAWMGNWAYAQTVPTTPWKGCQSIPRELKLVDQGKGYILTQKPIQELQTIRKIPFSQSNFKVNEGTTPVDLDLDWNVAEFKISYLIQNENQKFGINIAEGTNQKIIVRYDAKSSNLTIDRTNTPFNYAFNRIQKIPVYLSEDSILDLHIFVDQSSIEIFAEGYKYNMASLAFNDAAKNGISLFSEKGSVDVKSMVAWQLKSIWSEPSSVIDTPTKTETKIEISPNPVESILKYDLGPEHFASAYEVKIVDVSGKVLLDIDMSHPTDSLDVSFLTTGTYFLQIMNGEKMSTGSFFKK